MSLPTNFFIGRGGGVPPLADDLVITAPNGSSTVYMMSSFSTGQVILETGTEGVYTLQISSSFPDTNLRFELYGGQGGSASNRGGYGGGMIGDCNVTSFRGSSLYLVCGGAGTANSTYVSPISGAYFTGGGFNGGGRGVSNNTNGGNTGGGGGATDLRRFYSGNVTDYANAGRIYVAGGGGGGTSNSPAQGGGGGYPTGGDGDAYNGGTATGGTQSAGGNLNGSFGLGGENANNTGWNGGGGGGWYGGGAHPTQHGAGAGGSGYYDPSYISHYVSYDDYRSGSGYFKIIKDN